MKTDEGVFRKTLVGYAISGRATRWHGIVVTPELLTTLKAFRNIQSDTYMVTGTEGNRHITYRFYIIADPSIPKGNQFFMTHYTREQYERDVLGRIPELLEKERPMHPIAGTGLTVQVLNWVSGIVSVGSYSRTTNLFDVHYDEVMAEISAALTQGEPVMDRLYAAFDNPGMIRNPPEAHWLGMLTFDNGVLTHKEERTMLPYRCERDPDGLPQEAQVGHLLMDRKNGQYWIVGIAKDGLGNIRVIPDQETGDTDPMGFAARAIRYFLPEEIFSFLDMKKQSELDAIRALPHRELWGTWHDPERLGRLEMFSVTGGKNGHRIDGDFLNTRGKPTQIEVLFVEDTAPEDAWPKLSAKYFPEDWAGWPETAQDRSWNAMAAVL